MKHFINYGESEGRPGSEGCLRENIISCIPHDASVLETGSSESPVVKGKNVKYFSIGQSEAPERGKQKTDHPVTDSMFDAVVSSHTIEHQIDLITYLKKIEKLLVRGGRYYLMIPDKRIGSDHYIPESTIEDVLSACNTTATRHSLSNVMTGRALTTHNDRERHWAGDHADPGYMESIARRLRSAIADFEAGNDAGIDVRAWQFTPSGFRLITESLCSLNLIRLRAERVYNTPRSRAEFMAVLIRL
ncbi:methyltransferase domain-containing protein [Acetobacter oeni]|nr:methyltransferase domain-containing protein [Acetobacter oeni]MBB3882529.1 hypothetical protein [Acetobacter oeni]